MRRPRGTLLTVSLFLSLIVHLRFPEHLSCEISGPWPDDGDQIVEFCSYWVEQLPAILLGVLIPVHSSCWILFRYRVSCLLLFFVWTCVSVGCVIWMEIVGACRQNYIMSV